MTPIHGKQQQQEQPHDEEKSDELTTCTSRSISVEFGMEETPSDKTANVVDGASSSSSSSKLPIRRWYPRTTITIKIAVCVVLLILLVVVAVIDVPVLRRNHNNNSNNNNNNNKPIHPSPNETGDRPPTPPIATNETTTNGMDMVEREEWLRTVLGPVLLVPELITDNPTSPQAQAFAFLLDPQTSTVDIRTSLDTQGIVERYVLSVLGYSLSQTRGTTTALDWKESIPFLTPHHVCEWSTSFTTSGRRGLQGVTCNDKGYTTKLIFCT